MPPDDDDEFAELRAEEGNAILRLFLEYGRERLPTFVGGAGAAIVQMLMALVPSFVLAIAIDSLFFDTRAFSLPLVPAVWIPGDQGGQFLLAGGLVAASYALSSVFSWANNYLWNSFSQHFQHAVRVDTYDALQRQGVEFFDNRQTGEVMSILNNDVNQLEGFLTNNLKSLITIVVRVGGMGAVMLLINWRLALIPVAAIPALGYLSYWFVETIHPKYQEVRSAVGRLNSRLENNIGGIETLKSFTTEPFETDRVRESSREYLDSQWDAITTRIKFFPSLQATTAAAYVSVFFVGGWWVVTGTPPHPFFSGGDPDATLTAGTLVLFLNYSRRFVYPMRQMGQIINGYQYAEAAGERIVGLLDDDTRVGTETDGVELDDEERRTPAYGTEADGVEGHVEFDDVQFAYRDEDGEAEETVLRGISFEADAGDYVGLVGPTGAGKSTTMKLLLRFYDPDSGTIRLDGRDVRDIDIRSLREHVGYVSQEPYLFYGTVADNIAYGVPEYDDEAMHEAAETAGAHEFVADLEDGYDTMVGERGVKLSGGQRQRIALARTILRDPDVLVLDEATSHVDNETEAVIQNSLEALTEDRTVFAIAHRLSTVRDADQILVMDDGEIVERGDHERLIDGDGLYANLWRVQVGEMEALPESFVERSLEAQ
ncbi:MULTISPECIES: ABC transporter ATP-binding protein [Halolamina]|uniref:ATP-binding cassette, subfamily B n=1 Tax=Halolamina pelagica TaxID=699431 RepID=A0A1I5RWH2_9EURY|nr:MULTISPECIES: ABC transporter ATP-binding protein [Halolamina]NHX35382.1 ABC transporter ATP-binding protein [Halolamina sp. R1-12]SFP62875.1 ATP-binding cassette, subfamily B [Halolamina pelagica]